MRANSVDHSATTAARILYWVTRADERSSNTRPECTSSRKQPSPNRQHPLREQEKLRTGILMHERTEHERKTELYGVLLLCITAVQQSLHNPLTAYHTVVDEEVPADDDVVQKMGILSDPLALLGSVEFLVVKLFAPWRCPTTDRP